MATVGIDEEWFDRATQAKILAAIASVGTTDWMEFENGEDLLSHLRNLKSPGTNSFPS